MEPDEMREVGEEMVQYLIEHTSPGSPMRGVWEGLLLQMRGEAIDGESRWTRDTLMMELHAAFVDAVDALNMRSIYPLQDDMYHYSVESDEWNERNRRLHPLVIKRNRWISVRDHVRRERDRECRAPS